MTYHRFSILLFCCLVCVTWPVAGQSQSWDTSNGVLHVTDWPESATNKKSIDSLRVHAAVLPSIDTLSIGYGYRTTSAQPFLTFGLEWKPGPYVILDGEKTSWEDLRGDIQIETLRLRVDVVSDGELISDLDFVVDSLMLPPYPGLFSEEIGTLTWDSVFPDLPDSSARSLFEQGFSLENPRITHITFAFFDAEGNLARNNEPRVMPRRPSRRTVYGPNINIAVRIPVVINRPRAVPRSDDGPRTKEPRGERVGRGNTSDDDRRTSSDDRRRTPRTNDDTTQDEAAQAGDVISSSGKKKKKKDDSEEDEDDLLPTALAGAAAVAAVAVIGGTLGYYGNTKFAPIGLTSGFVRPKGGLLLQAAINGAVIERSETDTEHFLGRLLGFYNLFDSPVQPALGFGLLASEDDGDFDYDFSATVGLVGNFEKVILIGGYDFASGGVDIGLAVNFKAKD